MGRREYECTPWGNPTYNVFGWQKPCYLLQEGYAKTFRELMDSTEWDRYGTGRNENAPIAWCIAATKRRQSNDTFGTLSGFGRTVKLTMLPTSR